MQNSFIKKVFVFGILFLFFGVSVSSAISIETKSTTTYNENNDCDCNKIDKIYIIQLKKQLNRLEVYTKLLLVLSRLNPEIKGKCEQLSNEILTLKIMVNEITDNPYYMICLFLFMIFLFIEQLLIGIESLMNVFAEVTILFLIFLSIYYEFQNIIYAILNLMERLECEFNIPPP